MTLNIKILKKTYERTKTHEGGVANRPVHEDTGGLTNQGTSQRLLDSIKRKNPDENLPDKTTDLSKEKRVKIAKKEFWDILKVKKIKEIPNVDKASKNFTDQIFDIGFQSGPDTSGQILQKSLDEVVGTDLRDRKNKEGLEQYDGNIGPKTRAAISKAIQEGKLKEVNNKMVDNRMKYYDGLDNRTFNDGWVSRVESYRE